MTRERQERPPKPRATGRGDDPRVYEALGRAIKTARAERGLERKDLAAATSLSYAYLSDIESGRRRPSSSAIFEIARALEMNPSELMAWTEQLAHRIASEQVAEEASPSGPAGVPAAGFAASAAPLVGRRSWFAREDAEAQPAKPAPRRTHLRASDPSASFTNELELALESLGPEDLELVLKLAHRLSRAHSPGL
jgi:transcriptional regulator with XRE-family HTH domain